MEEKLDYEDFKPLFGDWAEKFRPFIESKEMFDIYQTLKTSNQTIVPESDKVFRAWQITKPENVKMIWYLMDPYPKRYKGTKINQATGIAMDCSNSPDGKMQPSLEKFYDSMEKDLGYKVTRNCDLTWLHEQGCMMLNTDLTCALNKTGSHKGLWEPFQKFFLEEVMYGTKDIIYVLAGEDSDRMRRYINPLGNHIFKLSHPVSASYTKTDWDSKGIFKKINEILYNAKQETICWDSTAFVEDLPF